MPTADFDILIVGAGIAGAALARRLAGGNLRVGLVEANAIDAAQQSHPPADANTQRIDDPPPQSHPPAASVEGFDSRVSAITPASQALFQTLGVWPRLEPAACPYRHMTVWDAEGTGLIEFDAAELDAPALGHIIENRAITAALLSGEWLGAVSLFSPARVAGLRGLDAGAPRLLLEGGGELSARLLVAADGAQSRVRDLAGFATREWDYGHHALVATVQTALPHAATAWQRFLPSGPLALLPLPARDGKHFCSIVWSAPPDQVEELQALPEADFCAALANASEYRLGDILAVAGRGGFPLRQRHAVDYVRPGVALVGDAAHSIHPLAGQGINLGLQDVAALAEELLRGCGRGAAPGDIALLRRYQRRRKGENLLMMTAMDGFKRLFERRELPLRWLRNTGMRLVGRAGPVKRRLMRHAMGVR